MPVDARACGISACLQFLVNEIHPWSAQQRAHQQHHNKVSRNNTATTQDTYNHTITPFVPWLPAIASQKEQVEAHACLAQLALIASSALCLRCLSVSSPIYPSVVVDRRMCAYAREKSAQERRGASVLSTSVWRVQDIGVALQVPLS